MNLSFPLNDEKYYFIGCAISLDDLINGDSEFGLKNYTSVIGINDLYKHNFRNKKVKIGDHLVIDLDKGDIYPGEDLKDNSVNEKNKKLIKLIEKLCKETDEDKIKTITLYQAINKLSKRLKSIYEKLYDSSIKSIPGEFIDYNKEKISLINKEIQESFYQFINNVCLYFYENLSIKATEDEGKKIQIKNDEEHDMNVLFDENYKEGKRYNEEELIFLEMIKMTMKYESFVYGFLQSYNPIDLYKIPLTFTEEFLSIVSRKKNEISKYNIKYFELIDELYSQRKLKNPHELNFNNIYNSFFKNLKNKIDKEVIIYCLEMITYEAEGVKFPNIKKRDTSNWIHQVAESYDKKIGEIGYLFVNDDKILEVNNQYLGHDYYTDIITFDYTEGKVLNGDIFISLDTVFTNADKFGRPYYEELHRVIIHGILHLCGINDKGPGEREIMEAAEDRALALLNP